MTEREGRWDVSDLDMKRPCPDHYPGIPASYCDRCAVLSLTKRLAEATELLKAIQWEGRAGNCPDCYRFERTAYGESIGDTMMDHAPDCRLAKFLEGT